MPLEAPVTIATLRLPESASRAWPPDEADPSVIIVFSLVGRLGVLPRRKHCPDQTVSLPLSAVPHYCHRQKESVPSRQDPTYSDSRRATPSAPMLSIDSQPTDDEVRLFPGRWDPNS